MKDNTIRPASLTVASLTLASVALASLTLAAPAMADEARKPTVALDFARLGFSSVPSVSDTSCTVAMNLDRRKFLEHMDEVKALGLLNPDELPNRIDAMPDTLSMAFALQFAPGVTERLYANERRADQCVFTQYLTVPDAGGVERPLRVFSYAFSRTQYDKTDWATMAGERFIRSTKSLHFDHDFQKRLRVEAYPHSHQ